MWDLRPRGSAVGIGKAAGLQQGGVRGAQAATAAAAPTCCSSVAAAFRAASSFLRSWFWLSAWSSCAALRLSSAWSCRGGAAPVRLQIRAGGVGGGGSWGGAPELPAPACSAVRCPPSIRSASASWLAEGRLRNRRSRGIPVARGPLLPLEQLRAILRAAAAHSPALLACHGRNWPNSYFSACFNCCGRRADQRCRALLCASTGNAGRGCWAATGWGVRAEQISGACGA